jgi:hypothetical protein
MLLSDRSCHYCRRCASAVNPSPQRRAITHDGKFAKNYNIFFKGV